MLRVRYDFEDSDFKIAILRQPGSRCIAVSGDGIQQNDRASILLTDKHHKRQENNRGLRTTPSAL